MPDTRPPASNETAAFAGGETAKAPLRICARELMQGHRTIVIAHGGHDYLLRITANGKLILTK